MAKASNTRSPIKGIVGGPMGTVTFMVIGIVGGIIIDMMWNSIGLPGFNAPLRGCDTLTMGDAIQMGATSGLTFFAFLSKTPQIPAFTFGLMMGGLFPKVITKAMNLPRYGLFDLDIATGQITPMANLRGAPLTTAPAPDIQAGPDLISGI